MSTLIKDKATNEWKTVNGVYISMPVGAVTAFMGTTAPAGWLICDGSTFNENEYPSLYDVLGSNVLPDLRKRFLQGADGNIGTYIEAGLPNIVGRASFPGALAKDGAFYNTTYGTETFSMKGSEGNGALALDASRSSSVYGKSETVQPPAYTVNYIIKAV